MSDERIDGYVKAKKAIIAECVRMHEAAGKPRLDGNYVGGRGSIACPVCKTGVLRFARASYNGHVHASCSTDRCVAWRE